MSINVDFDCLSTRMAGSTSLGQVLCVFWVSQAKGLLLTI